MKKGFNYFLGIMFGLISISLIYNAFTIYDKVSDTLITLIMAAVFGYTSYRFFNKTSKKYMADKRKKDILENTSLTEETLAELENGTIPIVYTDKLILKPDEVCHYYTNATRLIVKNKVVGYSGGSGGVNVRVAKGVSLRTGSHKGVPIRGDVTEETNGQLFITSERIIFMSAKNSFEITMKNIIATEYYSDGIGVQDNKTFYTLKLVASDLVLAMIRVLIVANQAL